jgi:HAE1 family hydrophobic/amphiphilic exporter-1
MGAISSLAVKRGVTFAMLYLIITGFGLFSLSQLKLDMFPDLRFPVVAIINTYMGVSPEEIETLVTRPLEMAVASVKNVKKIRSTSKHGASLLIVELEWGTDIDKAMIDMREKIDMFKSRLPEEARQPIMFAFDPSLQPIIIFSIRSTSDMVKLRLFLEQQFAPMLERISGVASSQVMGGKERAIRVLIDPRKLSAHGISTFQIIQALRADNVQLASGTLSTGKSEYTLRTLGTFKSVRQIRDVVIGAKGRPFPQPIYLWQVAKVEDSHKEETRIVQAAGQPGMLMMVQKRSDANTVQTARAVLENLPELQRKLPTGTTLRVIFNQSDFIEKSLSNLYTSAFMAFILAILVLLFFLRSLRSSLIIGISIPVSIIATFAVMHLGNITLNIISMAGLALAVGMLVDNSIVVLENIFRHLEEGKEPREAAMRGSREVAMAITASTLTTLAVFVPILFVPGLAGMMFRDMVVTICFSLTASLVVAITLIPLMTSRIFGRRLPANTAQTSPENNPEPPKKYIGNWLENLYTRTLRWALYYRKTTILLGFSTLVVALFLSQFIKTEFLPKADDSMILLQYERSPGTSLEETNRTAIVLEQIVRRDFSSMLEEVITDTGIGEGFVAIFGKGSHAGIMRMRLKPINQRPLSKMQIQERLRQEFAKIPGLKYTFELGGTMMFGGSDIEIQLFGYDLKAAEALAEQVKKVIERIPGTADLKTSLEENRPELQIHLRRDHLRRLGLNAYTVSNTVSTAFKGTIATLYREGDNEFSVIVQLQDRYRTDVNQIKQLDVFTPTGKSVPLSSIADIRYGRSLVTIERQDQNRISTVFVSVTDRGLATVIQDIRDAMEREVTMPPGFYYKIGGQAEDFLDSFKWLAVAFLASIILVYMVMASQFESLFEPFVILFSIPLAIIGVLLALLITNTNLSVMAFVGVIMLVGIVVNNAIVLIDFIKQNREEHGTEIIEACILGGRVRLRPILMTAATTILGMLPLALGLGEGAETWMGLGRVVMGGLLTSTFLTLYIVPTLLASFTIFADKIKLRIQKRRTAH